jgi:hypothetical protein
MEGFFSPAGYLGSIVLLAFFTHALHVFITTKLLKESPTSSTLFSRSGWGKIVRVCCCVCLCPSLQALDQEDIYEMTKTAGTEFDDEEDVTAEPENKA